MTHTVLIQNFLTTTSITDFNSFLTSACNTGILLYTDGTSFNEPWKYSTVLGILVYLASNPRPDIAFSVHQCACFTHAPHKSHAKSFKHILRYIKVTSYKGLILELPWNLQVDYYFDAEFSGISESKILHSLQGFFFYDVPQSKFYEYN